MCKIIKPLSGGLINDTWLASDNGIEVVVQRINTNVFSDPDAVMENIVAITTYIREKLKVEGRNPERETLTFLPFTDGNYLLRTESGVFRKSIYISDSFTIEKPQTAMQMWEAGRLYGDFQRLLSDFPVLTLHETIPDFHNTLKRLNTFKRSVEIDCVDRRRHVTKEIEFLEEHSILASHFQNSPLPMRVTHNDTKLANLLFDKFTNKALAVVDLETVMPGLSVLDFGDSIRSGAFSISEDNANNQTVEFIPEYYYAFKEGFLSETKEILTLNEIHELTYGAAVIIYEQALRFLTDYLDGDVYFKTTYSEHNLVRTRNQIQQLREFLHEFPLL